jgi:hypothetical protein
MDWQVMAALGAYHGLNPGMGWLFAVALGLQEGSVRGVWRALPPLAAGHALSVAVVLGAVGLARLAVPPDALRLAVAALLVSFGLYRLWRHRHPRFGGMRVGFRDLTIWSFLMASAHGAGLMVLAFVMPTPGPLAAASPSHVHRGAPAGSTLAVDVMAISIHTTAFLVVMTFAAWVVYRRLGLRLLRSAWLNLDWVWAGALVAAGVVVLWN